MSAAAPTPAPRSLTGDATLMLGAKGLVGACSFAATVVVARALGLTAQGHIAIALGFLLLLQQLANFGLVTASSAFAARDRQLVPALVGTSLLLGFVFSFGAIVVVIGVLLIAPQAAAGLTTTELAITFAAVPFAITAVGLQRTLLGAGRPVASNLSELAVSFVTLVAVGLGVTVGGLGTTGALCLLMGQYPVFLAVVLVALVRGADRPRVDRPLGRALLQWGIRVYMATIVGYLLVRLDLLLVGAILGPNQAGLYSAAATIAQGLYLLPIAIGTNLLPRVAAGAPAAVTARVFRLTALGYGAGCVVLALISTPLIHLVFGAPYLPAAALLRWLLPGTFALGLCTVLSSHFAGEGVPRQVTIAWAIGLVLNIGLNVALLKPVGTEIAPIASSVCYLLVLALLMRLFRHRNLASWDELRPRWGELRQAGHSIGQRVRPSRTPVGHPPTRIESRS